MRRAVDDFKRSVNDVDSKLDMLEWKVRTLADGDQGPGNNESVDETNNRSLFELLDAAPRVTKKYEDVVQKLHEAEKDVQQVSDQLTNELDRLNAQLKKLREKVSDGLD